AELALTEPEKAIDHPSVDVVIIVTPTNTHARLIELAANAGKAVFSEKPIALDLAETERIVQVVRERKVPVQLGFMRRYDPGYAKAKAKIEAGELGKLETFRALSRDTYPPSLEFLLGSGGLFLDMSVAFFAALREGRTLTPGPEDALETLRLAVAATKSWREKRPVKISEISA